MMRKLIYSFVILAVAMVACQDNADEVNPNQEISAIDMSDFYLYTNDDDISAKSSDKSKNEKCYTMQVLNVKLKENPGLYKRMYDIEKHTRQWIAAKKPDGTPGGGGGGNGGGGGGGETGSGEIAPYGQFSVSNTIPVVFHIIYRSDSENISDTQLDEQIAALNVDFNGNNPSNIPADFAGLEADLGVNFAIAGVIRTQNKKKRSWRPDDTMKFSSTGGSDVVDPNHYLNIWVVNNMPYQGGNILGYAQFPGGDWATDGIVLDHRFVGNTQYSTGRTATHEIGHWMNLRHIWGDGGCSYDDFVSDTPTSDRYNTGCPTFPEVVHCESPDMFMNFMDYTNDTCMSLFTVGQEDRMAALFVNGGFRFEMGIAIN